MLSRDVLSKKGKLTTCIKCEKVSLLEYFEQNFLLGAGRAMWSMSEGVMHVSVSCQSQSGLYQRTNSYINLETCQITVCSSVKHLWPWKVKPTLTLNRSRWLTVRYPFVIRSNASKNPFKVLDKPFEQFAYSFERFVYLFEWFWRPFEVNCNIRSYGIHWNGSRIRSNGSDIRSNGTGICSNGYCIHSNVSDIHSNG